ncbi:MAG TPA: acetolactate synthase large subunit, partial [Acidimicrobiales bacterium]|nr:acetolactate synthase large subunit [Acidimicrobiales bacterium]
MNGAQALLRTLVDSGVDVCFTNPGTSEMHFVAALDDVPEMRGVLALFEGVATGAADGYARMADKPAATLLHLGPGLGNGLANLHNARKGKTGVVNIVGDHATYHKKYDAQLESDIETVARNVSSWIWRSETPDAVARDAAEAVAVARTGQVATLILPADASWLEGATPAPPAEFDEAPLQSIETIPDGALLFLGGIALREEYLEAAARTGCRLLAETFPTRLQRGAGRVPIDRLAYLAEFASMQLDGTRDLVLCGAKSPVSFFAYPGKASDLVPEGCRVHVLDPRVLLEMHGTADVTRQLVSRPDRPTGALTAETVAAAIGALLPEGAIVSDEANTAGLFVPGATAGAPPHDWLCLTGGAIGQGLPVAVGAAVACPDRKVLALEADGSAMYTLQSLWTMAREGLDVVTVIYNNRAYAVLNMELGRVGASGQKAKDMFDLRTPPLDFVALSTGMGVPATRATTADEFTIALEK